MMSLFSFFTKPTAIDPYHRIAGEAMRREGEREMSDILPPELWTEILVRLPARTLLTLKCVSKSFLSFIQNPNFVSMHFSRFNSLSSESNHSDLLLLERFGSFTVCRGDTSTKRVEFAMTIDSGDNVVGYVNGLLWLHMFNSSIKYMLLCNPSIRKCLLIPPSPASNLGRTFVGFGYDPITDDYKAVVIVFDLYAYENLVRTFIEVYSLKTGSWRRVGFDRISRKWFLRKSAYANGSVHWLAGVCGEEYFLYSKEPNVSHVLSFDLSTEVLKDRELPKADEHDGCNCQGILKLPLLLHGSLAVLYISCTHICIWVVEENGWAKEYMIESSLSRLHSYLFNVDYDSVRVVDRIKNAIFCEKSGELLIAAQGEGVISYNINTRKYRISHHCVAYVGRYVENLLWRGFG